MAELDHVFGYDLSVSPTGDLLVAAPPNEGVERVLRRLLTNQGDYLWHPDYGAGLPARVGDTLNVPYLTAIAASQIGLEAAVAQAPEPVVTVTPLPQGASLYVRYADSTTGQTVTTPAFDVTQ